MATYRTYITKAGVATANTVMWQLRNPASRRALINQIGIFIETAPTIAPQFRITRSLTLGTSSATSVLQPGDPDSQAANLVLDTAWSAAPTFTTAGPFYDGWPGMTAIGQGVVYTYSDLWVPAGTAATSGLQIVNLAAQTTTAGVFGLQLRIDE